MVVWPTLHGHRDRGVEMDLKQRFCSIRCFRVRTVSHASTSSSMVLPRLRKGSVDPPGNICVYIHLLGTWMTSISASLSAKFRQALPSNNRCTLYTTFQNPNWKERQATLNQTVMHICCKRSCKKKEQGVAHAAQAGCCPA
jgi:hypothetical protein